jgi:hypothetical protein
MEIQQLLTAYAGAVDAGRFDDLDELFTDDAIIDLSATGGRYGPYREVISWLSDTLSRMGAYMHVVSNIDVRLHGDGATARTACLNPLALDAESKSIYLICFWYDDEFARTADGWRFRSRSQIRCLDKLL